jgi:hypothetical protein
MDKQTKVLFFLVGACLLAAPLFFVLRNTHSPKEPAAQVATSTTSTNTAVNTAAPPITPIQLSPAEQKKIEVFEDILKSRNDNDPRIDQEFHALSPALKKALEDHYQSMPREERNGRGLVVFLVTRSLNSADDLAFIRSVYEEPPCTNMDGCSAAPSTDSHLSGIENTSLNYPQLVGLYQLEKQVRNNPSLTTDASLNKALLDVLEKAKSFPVQAVQQRANAIYGFINKTPAK